MKNARDMLLIRKVRRNNNDNNDTATTTTTTITTTTCRESNTKYVSWCTSVCIRLHQHTSLNCAHWCLNQPIVVTCSAARGDLAVPRSRTTRYGQRCFAVSGPTLCNSLPLSVRDPSLTLTQFWARLKTVILQSIQNTTIALTWQFIDL